jgi:hypothetical protein
MDIEVIKMIPICTALVDDFWAWQFENIGVFSVHSPIGILLIQRKSEMIVLRAGLIIHY